MLRKTNKKKLFNVSQNCKFRFIYLTFRRKINYVYHAIKVSAVMKSYIKQA